MELEPRVQLDVAGPSGQLAELIALTQAFELGKGKRIAIYTDSKYVFVVLHAHAAIWKEGGHLTTRGSPVKYSDQILRLLEAIHLLSEVSVSHCKGHQNGSMEVARGNQVANQAAKRAVLQNSDL
ncbi:ribonuclease H-like [Muntiacus reevesi]|uniref:ribonuclease H-like n=1 Tax=Muntiacus reevesi TaxID=9886 RepID=UPI0033072B70